MLDRGVSRPQHPRRVRSPDRAGHGGGAVRVILRLNRGFGRARNGSPGAPAELGNFSVATAARPGDVARRVVRLPCTSRRLDDYRPTEQRRTAEVRLCSHRAHLTDLRLTGGRRCPGGRTGTRSLHPELSSSYLTAGIHVARRDSNAVMSALCFSTNPISSSPPSRHSLANASISKR